MTAAWIVATHVLPSGVTCVASEEEAERVAREMVSREKAERVASGSRIAVREPVVYRVEVDERHVEGALGDERGGTALGDTWGRERASDRETGEA